MLSHFVFHFVLHFVFVFRAWLLAQPIDYLPWPPATTVLLTLQRFNTPTLPGGDKVEDKVQDKVENSAIALLASTLQRFNVSTPPPSLFTTLPTTDQFLVNGLCKLWTTRTFPIV